MLCKPGRCWSVTQLCPTLCDPVDFSTGRVLASKKKVPTDPQMDTGQGSR